MIRDNEALKAGKGRLLHMEITNAVSMGNPSLGHQKQVSVKGHLFDDGIEIGALVACGRLWEEHLPASRALVLCSVAV